MAAGAVSLRKSHDIVILSFCNKIKGQDNILMLRVGGSKLSIEIIHIMGQTGI